MDTERRIELVKRAPTDEVITDDELKHLLETESRPVAYNGFEPSGRVHLGTGLICAYKMRDFIEAGFDYRVYLATWHAWINGKLGGDKMLIRKAAQLFVHAWAACGVPRDRIQIIWPDDVYDDIEYWNKVVAVAKAMTVARTVRTLEVAGRHEAEARYVADLLYTPMQVADVFHFGVRCCQLGMDQRKANVVARELGEKLGFWKPVCVHHHLLQGLAKPAVWPLPDEPVRRKEVLAAGKMSKSKPETCVFIDDEPEAVRKKINSAFCPEKAIEFNPVLEIVKYVIFRERDALEVKRAEKYGGRLEFYSFDELQKAYADGKLHPTDLKAAVADSLAEILAPVRAYFEKNREARELRDAVAGAGTR